MKALVTADLHLKLWPDRDYDVSGLPMKLLEIISCVKQMADYARQNSINTIIIAGDINDTKGLVSVRAFVLFRELLQRYTDINWIILHGNHDATTGSDQQEHSAIQLLEGYENIRVILEAQTETFDNTLVCFVPHSKNIVNVLGDVIGNMQGDKQAILISHFGLDEAQLASGISIRAGISARDLTMFKLVLLGHYHTPQNLKSYETEIHYTGSPIPVRRDEAGEEKRFLVVDTDTLEVTSVPTEGYRRYIELVLDEDTNLKEFTEQIELYKRLNYFVIIKKNIANVPSELKECMETTQVIDNFEKDPTLRGITSGMSPEEQCKKYLEIIMMPEEEWEEYVKIAMEIITEAEEVT